MWCCRCEHKRTERILELPREAAGLNADDDRGDALCSSASFCQGGHPQDATEFAVWQVPMELQPDPQEASAGVLVAAEHAGFLEGCRGSGRESPRARPGESASLPERPGSLKDQAAVRGHSTASAIRISCNVEAQESLRRKGWRRRCVTFAHRSLAVICPIAARAVAFLTAAAVALNFIAFGGCGVVGQCRQGTTFDIEEALGPEDYMQAIGWFVFLSFFGMLLVAPPTVWLLAKAPTTYLRCMASYMGFIWLSVWLALLFKSCYCYAPNSAWAYTIEKFAEFVTAAMSNGALAMFVVLVLVRLNTLEANSKQHLGTRSFKVWFWMWSMSYLLAHLLLVPATLSLEHYEWNTQKVVIGCVSWFSLVTYFAMIVAALRVFRSAYNSVRAAGREADSQRQVTESRQASRALLAQMWGTLFTAATGQARCFPWMVLYETVWPVPVVPAESRTLLLYILSVPVTLFLDTVSNVLCALVFSGALSGVVTAGLTARQKRQQRSQRWECSTSKFRGEWHCSADDERVRAWQSQVHELAGRGFTLGSLLAFYRKLGAEWMPHYDPSRHTTSDVVRQAVIPMSCAGRCALATLMMDGEHTRPNKMVTHNWSNLFCDLVAAIVADALGECEYAKVSYLLKHDIALLEEWVGGNGTRSQTYWVCALSVNQHLGICGSNPADSVDTVTGRLHPTCHCGHPKAWNTTEPTLPDGRSIHCEMNKFDDMMRFLAATDRDFQHVIAVDSEFVLFSRAWCVSEIVAGHSAGMEQHLRLHSPEGLHRHQATLQSLKIQDMEATRPEDKAIILESIPDVDAFNTHMQNLLFEELIPSWSDLDPSEQVVRIGQISRWQYVTSIRHSAGIKGVTVA